MSTGGIVIRKPGHFIPNAYLELALKENPSGWGAAIFNDGELKINHGEAAELEFFQETMKTFESDPIVFFFCNSTAPFSETDISPYVIVKDGDFPALVAFVDGNSPGAARVDSTHPPSFFVANDYLVPKFQSLLDMADGNLEKVLEQLQKPFFKKELQQQFVSRGYVTFMAANGAVETIQMGDTHSEYPWGWVSNNYGYAIGPGKKEEPKAPAKVSMFPSKGKTVSTVRETPAAAAAISAATKPPATAATVIKNYTIQKWKPSATLSRSERKEKYKQLIGYCPDGWEKGIEVEVYYSPENKLLTFAEVKKNGLAVAGLPRLNNPKAKHEKDVEPHAVKSSDTLPVTTEILPIISPAAREYIKKMIAENATPIADPKQAKELEAKFATFAVQMGCKDIGEMLPWSFKMMYDLAKEKPDGMAVLAWTLQNIYMANRSKKADAAVAPAAAAPAAQAPARQSMFPSKKTATG